MVGGPQLLSVSHAKCPELRWQLPFPEVTVTLMITTHTVPALRSFQLMLTDVNWFNPQQLQLTCTAFITLHPTVRKLGQKEASDRRRSRALDVWDVHSGYKAQAPPILTLRQQSRGLTSYPGLILSRKNWHTECAKNLGRKKQCHFTGWREDRNQNL